MSFAIISGRNNGYPCIPELDELISAERKPPYSDFMMIAAGNSYPVIKKLALKKKFGGSYNSLSGLYFQMHSKFERRISVFAKAWNIG